MSRPPLLRHVIRTAEDFANAMQGMRSVCGPRIGGEKPIEVTVQNYTQRRSSSQNRTMHMWFGEIADQTGHSKEEVKLWLKQEFLPEVEIEICGRTRTQPQETSGLDKPEAFQFMERVQALCAEMGFVITQPADRDWQRWEAQADEELRRRKERQELPLPRGSASAL